ncbi:MAG: DUF3450 domain-containing protein [Gammaproteobacteria bacterium]
MEKGSLRVSPPARTARELGLALGLSLCLMTGLCAAESLDAAVRAQTQNQEQGIQSQTRVEKLDDATQAMLSEYRDGIRELESLRVYHAQLQREIRSQETERASVAKQLAEIQVTQRGILPLMLRMQEFLEKFVKMDVPFLEAERNKRIDDLKTMMGSSEVTLAEKYRRLMEAYQVESEYGRTIEAYRGDLKEKDDKSKKQVRAVDFLRFGRLALYYLTLDRLEAGYWDPKTKRFEKLPLEYRNDIERGLRIARKQAAPDLLKLPMPVVDSES